MSRVRSQLKALPSHYVTIREDLEERERYWERQLNELETKAVRAGVPASWTY